MRARAPPSTTKGSSSSLQATTSRHQPASASRTSDACCCLPGCPGPVPSWLRRQVQGDQQQHVRPHTCLESELGPSSLDFLTCKMGTIAA